MPSLYLCAADPHWIPDGATELLQRLDALGLLQAPAADTVTAGRYRAGPEFLSLVMFLGCSPRVTLEPEGGSDGQAPCFLRQHLYSAIHRIGATPALKPRCPGCRSPQAAVDPAVADASYRCETCGIRSAVSDLDWRRSLGFGRCFLEIAGVHPHEAVPSDKLLDALRDYSETDWRYFYAG